MADEPGKRGQEPNLELPSLLGFGRKKKRKPDTAPDAAPPAAAAVDQPLAVEAAEPDSPLAADPVPQPRGGLAPAAEKAKRLPPVPPPTARASTPTPRVTEPPPPVEPEPVVMEAPEAVEAVEEPVVVEEPVSFQEPVRFEEPSPPVTPPEPTSMLPAPPFSRETADAEIEVPAPAVAPAPAEPATPAAAGPSSRTPSLKIPAVDPRLAAFVTGAVVGLLGVLLAVVAGRGCEAVRGVGTCGGIGLFALLVILVVEVVLGAALLRAWRIHDPVSTSFLGVGLVAVFALLFLLGTLESVWMLVVIPVLSGLTFTLSWWVTSSFVEDAGRA